MISRACELTTSQNGRCIALSRALSCWSIATRSLLNHFGKDESGATAIEYGLIATLIGVAIILGASALGIQLNSVFNGISTKVIAP
jgi:pilus assembly protein Flp/PilA